MLKPKSKLLLIGIVAILSATTLSLKLTDHRNASSLASHATTFESGTQLIAVVITASFCIGTKYEGFHDAIPKLQQILRDRAGEAGVQFATIGVSLDWSLADGLNHLSNLATFDEVSAGRNWLNSSAVQFIWRDLPSEPVVPQVLVFDRTMHVAERGIEFGEDRLLARKLGADEIVEWVEAGVPLRLLPVSP